MIPFRLYNLCILSDIDFCISYRIYISCIFQLYINWYDLYSPYKLAKTKVMAVYGNINVMLSLKYVVFSLIYHPSALKQSKEKSASHQTTVSLLPKYIDTENSLCFFFLLQHLVCRSLCLISFIRKAQSRLMTTEFLCSVCVTFHWICIRTSLLMDTSSTHLRVEVTALLQSSGSDAILTGCQPADKLPRHPCLLL